MRSSLLLLPLALACQEPFDVNRKDLGPFRIAALGVEGGVARAAVWSGEGLVHAASPTLSWTLDGAPLGEGFDVPVPGGGTLGLIARSPSGEELAAQVQVAEAPAAPALRRLALGLVDDPSLDARRALEGVAVDHGVGAGEAARLVLDGLAPEATLRWMSAEGRGSLLELDAASADLLPEELTYDDGALVDREPSGEGVYTQLALVLGGGGANTWVWADVAVGLDGPFLRSGERLVPVDAGVEPGLVAFTLSWSPEAGLSFGEAAPAADLGEMDLPCARPGLPFDLDQVAEGRCPGPQLDGARVVMELR